jgi:hypothetical protein
MKTIEATNLTKVHKTPIDKILKKAVSLHKKKCIHPGCILFACYGLPHQKKLYCLTHKPKDKNLIRSGIFCQGKCGKQANFGPPDFDIKTHCKTCKPDNYVSKKKICTFEGCTSIAVKKNPSDLTMNLCSKHFRLVSTTS